MIHLEPPYTVLFFPWIFCARLGAAGMDAGAQLCLAPSIHSPTGLVNEACVCAQEPA